MAEPKVAIYVLTLALLAPQGLAAQVASKVEAGALVTHKDGELPSNVLQLAPGVRYEGDHLKLSAQGAAWFSEQQWQVADGIVSGTLTSPTVYGVRAELLGNASRAFTDQSLGSDQVDVQTRIHVLFKQHGGVWIGGGIARPWRVAVISSVDVTGGGAWTNVGPATLTTNFTNFSFIKAAPGSDTSAANLACSVQADAALPMATSTDRPLLSTAVAPTKCNAQSHYSDLEGAVHWEHGNLELDAHSGYRFGTDDAVMGDSRRWSSGSATVWVSDRMAFVAGGGRQPANYARGIPARTFGTVGMLLAYWPMSKTSVPVEPTRAMAVRSFEIRPTTPGVHKIIIRVGGVESVDVMGDFSDWNPLTLVRRGRDLWELSIPLSAGMHQINVRVDKGPWMAPPGMPLSNDGFNGEVGLLVVGKDK